MSDFAEEDPPAVSEDGGFVVLLWLSTGRLGSLSFDDAAAGVIAAGPALALSLSEVVAAGVAVGDFRFITGRSGSPSSTVVCVFALGAAGGSSDGPMVGFELESAGALFMVGRSGSVLAAGAG